MIVDGCWLVTGCSTGFGRVLALELLARGEKVALTARDPATLAEVLARYPETATGLALDVAAPETFEAVLAEAQDRLGPVAGLVNNAGSGHFGVVETAAVEDARRMMEVNFFGPLALTRAAMPGMIARGSGRIVNVGSVAGEVGFPGIAYYSSSKFALAGLTESLAAELAPLGIAVVLAELGPFATNFTPAMTMSPPPAHYDMGALSVAAGNSHWGAGHDPADAARALVDALADSAPPWRLVLGALGVEVVERHDARRKAEAARWHALSMLEPGAVPA